MSLLDRQDELQSSARRVLASLAPLGALMPTGSFVSGLMVWKDLDLMLIKDVWHRRPEYPDEVSGFEIYTAVLEHGVGTPEEFGAWLTR